MPHPIAPPNADEYAPYYAGYVARVAGRDLHAILERQMEEVRALTRSLSEEEGASRYAPGKWSVKEVLCHLSDTERVMSYRLLRVARGDTTPLPGFDQDDYVAASQADARSVESLVAELDAVRAATLALVGPLGAEVWTRRGSASGHEVSAGALAHIIAGHVEHHLAILRERYELGAA